jgi:hypothetical protein
MTYSAYKNDPHTVTIQLEVLSVAQLQATAKDYGIEYSDNDSREQLIEKIRDYEFRTGRTLQPEQFEQATQAKLKADRQTKDAEAKRDKQTVEPNIAAKPYSESQTRTLPVNSTPQTDANKDGSSGKSAAQENEANKYKSQY